MINNNTVKYIPNIDKFKAYPIEQKRFDECTKLYEDYLTKFNIKTKQKIANISTITPEKIEINKKLEKFLIEKNKLNEFIPFLWQSLDCLSFIENKDFNLRGSIFYYPSNKPVNSSIYFIGNDSANRKRKHLIKKYN